MKQILAIPEQLAPILQSARKSAGLSQGVLSKRMGMSQSRMSAIELDPASMRLEQLLSICAILQLELVDKALRIHRERIDSKFLALMTKEWDTGRLSVKPTQYFVTDSLGLAPDTIYTWKISPVFCVGQKFDFKAGDQVVANGYRGAIAKVCDGQLAGMVEVRFPGGVACMSASFPDCFPAVTNDVEVVTEGSFSGTVKEVSAQFVVQDVGRGRLVAHEVSRFASLPLAGENIALKYKHDKVAFEVVPVKAKGVGR